MSWLRSGLFRKFVTVMGALALIPVALLGVQLTGISRRGIQGAVLELHTKLAEGLAEKVDDYFKNSNEKVLFALSSLQRKMEWTDKQELLRALIETHGDIVEISMVNARGAEVVKVYNPDYQGGDALVSRAAEAGYREFSATRTRTFTLIVGGPRGAPAVEIYYPMNPAVAARLVISLRMLAERIASERVGGTGFAVLVGEKGAPVLYPPEKLSEDRVARFSSWPIVTAAVQANSLGSSEFVDDSGLAWVGAYAPVYGVGKAVLILQSRDEAYQSAAQMRRTALAVVLAVGLLCVVAATFLARRLTEPIFRLTKAAEAVSRGDFLAKVELHSSDELQDFAETFNRMTAQLRSYSVLQVDRLIAEQRKTEAIMFSISDAIMMLGKDGKVQLANRRALEFFGLNPLLSIEGKTVFEALPESTLRDAVVAMAAEAKPESFREVDLSTEQAHRYLRVLAHPVRTPKGAELGVVVAVRDVTLERELDKMKEEFLHYITHDLRNPLGSALGFVDVLLKGTAGVLTPDQHSIVSSIKRSSTRLMALVNNILDIAKMESGKIRLQLRMVSLAGIAGRSISILESLARAKKIELVLDAPEEYSVQCDPDLIERVLTNLLGNAIKYTPESGKITISVVEEGGSIKVCVADTGDGIPPEYLDRIFQKFEQVQGQRRGGTGLGLTISKFFIEAHLGWIWVESEVAKGSRFYFTIPKNLREEPGGGVSIGVAAAEAKA